jgi:DNA-binding CsgD family transcriptional regulator
MSETQDRSDDKVFERFAAIPGLGVCVMEPDGTMVYVNETATRMYGGGTVEEHIGRKLGEVYPPEWAAEKIALLKRVVETDERLVIRYIWNGRRFEVQYQKIDADGEGSVHVLVTAREGITDDDLLPDDFKIITTGTANFGPLAVLSPRELEVLALIGQGKSAKQIGEILTLSPRTVERHRDSIGKKLDKHDRVSLALIAQAAGLELRDAHLTPVGPMVVERPKRAEMPTIDAEVKPQTKRPTLG